MVKLFFATCSFHKAGEERLDLKGKSSALVGTPKPELPPADLPAQLGDGRMLEAALIVSSSRVHPQNETTLKIYIRSQV